MTRVCFCDIFVCIYSVLLFTHIVLIIECEVELLCISIIDRGNIGIRSESLQKHIAAAQTSLSIASLLSSDI